MIFLIDTALGRTGIEWIRSNSTASVSRIYLPGELSHAPYPEAALLPPPVEIQRLAEKIQRFLAGNDVDFSLENFAMGIMYPFQKKVLSLCRQIPRGKVSTYGRLAEKLFNPRAARAVGTALARNPFPLVIPCHRVVRRDADPGNFGGGRPMKRSLLQMEGVRFDAKGMIFQECFW